MRLIFLLLCISFSLYAKDIRISTYNVENLFDGVNNGNEYRDFKVGKYGWNKKMADIKLQHTIKAIKSINADIIALQEIENNSLLKVLAKKTNFKYYTFTKPFGSPVGVGVLSNYPILSKKAIKPGIEKMRDFLHVSIKIDENKLGLWIVHFPTQKYPYKKRLKVAKTLKKAVENSKEKDFLLLGDFNTKLSSKSILQKTFGSFGNNKNYYDPWTSISYKNRYSQVFYGRKSALDRIIIGKGLFDDIGLEYKNNSFKVIKNNFLSNKKGYPNRWKMKGKNSKRHQGVGYSDHFPIMLTLSTKPNEKKVSKIYDIDRLYKLKAGKVNLRVEKAVVIYKNKYGVILSQKGRGIYVFKAGFDLKYGYMYDLEIKNIADYKGLREITSLHVKKDYGKVDNLDGYFIKEKNLKKARANDVIKSIKGSYEKGYLKTKYGKIKVYVKDKKRLKKFLNLKEVRVGLYKGQVELILENKE